VSFQTSSTIESLDLDLEQTVCLPDRFWAYQNQGVHRQAHSLLGIVEGIRKRLPREEQIHLDFARARMAPDINDQYEAAKAQSRPTAASAKTALM
jgi:hypothetical protein